MVKTPSTVPKGKKAQETAAMTRQQVQWRRDPRKRPASTSRAA
jgi:hypothetical protein